MAIGKIKLSSNQWCVVMHDRYESGVNAVHGPYASEKEADSVAENLSTTTEDSITVVEMVPAKEKKK